MKTKNPSRGGAYYKSAPGSDAILVGGTDRQPTEQDQKALEAARRLKAQPTETDAKADQSDKGDRSK